ncbi:cysteine synthase A [Saccharothrix coeruleofusca]|uniref:pyridoxal-phosphate dependent enzyme n=1 Tax=Saccharothrix coeruleofusca TaxID=33919 RepID=UPI001AE36B47|nr:pyridoxal-phosphate dependent enzyme [Saccharothrix coeruleofusca]MBP2337247.1 cysteine synthase A [Saccharothrix coeruleofusca]
MHDHVATAIGTPDLIAVEEGVVCLRFETMKVVSAMAAVEHLLDRGLVRPGDTLVDSSSGIYAYALALACHRFGMRCLIIGSTTVDATLRTQLAILGAELEQMPPSANLKHDQDRRVRRIREILAEHPDYHWMRQYHDDIHYLGYRPIAERLAAELGDGITLVGGVGSGASTGALATYLRRDAPDTTLVGVQPFGSITFGAEHVHDPEIIIAGIGSSIVFDNVSHRMYDTIHWTSFDTAMSGSVDLLRRHAVFAGLSTGAAYACARWERGLAPTRTVVFIAADTGHRYAESVFARHERAAPLDSLAPTQVSTTDELALPWCRMDWKRAPAPTGHR